MIDNDKRTTLKVLGTGAGVTVAGLCLPQLATAVCSVPLGTSEYKSVDNLPPPTTRVGQIEIFLDDTTEPTITFKNISDRVAIVRHVYPGIVHSGVHTFDINSVLEKSAIGIGAGRSRTFRINPTYSTRAERPFAGLKQRLPNQLAHLQGANPSGQIIDSSRSFYS